MKKIIPIVCFILLTKFSCGQFAHQNISLLGQFNDPAVVAEPVYQIRYQSCWGWVNPADQKEYGIIGSSAGTYIIDVTDPTNLVQADYIPHRQADCIWHEYKTYGNFLYIISDDGGNNSLQIADLSSLPDSATIIYDSNSIFTHSHTLTIDGNKMYVASVTAGANYSSMNVYSLNNPALPVLLKRLDSDFSSISQVHDMFVVNDTVYASCGYSGLFIFHYDSIANHFTVLGSLTNFPTSRYNHSSVLSKDHQYLYMCDEVPAGMPFTVVNVSDIANPTIDGTYITNVGATLHNPYVKDDFLYIAGYEDGLYVYNISTPNAPSLAGYFDTHPQNTPGSYSSQPYQGAWAVYTDLPSGTLLLSDMQYGLFTLDVDSLTSGIKPIETRNDINIYPNPAKDYFTVSLNHPEILTKITLTNEIGKIIFSTNSFNQNKINIQNNNFEKGIYFVNISCEKENVTKKICLIN